MNNEKQIPKRPSKNSGYEKRDGVNVKPTERPFPGPPKPQPPKGK